MTHKLLIYFSTAVMIIFIMACSQEEYSLGDLTPPSNLAIVAEVVGATSTSPEGDGTGDVKFKITGDNVLSSKIDYDASDGLNYVFLPSGSITKKYTTLGTNTYLVTAVVTGKGGTSSTITKEIKVKSDFNPDPNIVKNLTGNASKSWVVDKSLPGHLGVGPWAAFKPEWWAAGVNEKVNCCNCFYTTTFTFEKGAGNNVYALKVVSPDGVFTKTGALTGIPGIPATGAEGCYPYAGATSSFSFAPSTTGVPVSQPSTQTSILLPGNTTFIGYGSLLKEYEILELTPTYMHLRVQGTETGNSWYLKLKSI